MILSCFWRKLMFFYIFVMFFYVNSILATTCLWLDSKCSQESLFYAQANIIDFKKTNSKNISMLKKMGFFHDCFQETNTDINNIVDDILKSETNISIFYKRDPISWVNDFNNLAEYIEKHKENFSSSEYHRWSTYLLCLQKVFCLNR